MDTETPLPTMRPFDASIPLAVLLEDPQKVVDMIRIRAQHADEQNEAMGGHLVLFTS